MRIIITKKHIAFLGASFISASFLISGCQNNENPHKMYQEPINKDQAPSALTMQEKLAALKDEKAFLLNIDSKDYNSLSSEDINKATEILNAKINDYRKLLSGNLKNNAKPLGELGFSTFKQIDELSLAGILKVFIEKNLILPKTCSGHKDVLAVIKKLAYKLHNEVEDDSMEHLISLLGAYEKK